MQGNRAMLNLLRLSWYPCLIYQWTLSSRMSQLIRPGGVSGILQFWGDMLHLEALGKGTPVVLKASLDCSGVIPGHIERTYVVLGIKLWLAGYKATALSSVIYLSSLLWFGTMDMPFRNDSRLFLRLVQDPLPLIHLLLMVRKNRFLSLLTNNAVVWGVYKEHL